LILAAFLPFAGALAADDVAPSFEADATARAPATGASSALLMPQFSGVSGDFSLYYRPSIGVLHVDDEGRPATGFYLDTLSNRRTGPTSPERVRLGEYSESDAWDVGAVVGYQLGGNAAGTAAGVNLQLVTASADPYAALLVQPGFDYTVPFSDSLQLSARLFSTYSAGEAGGNTAAVGAASNRFDEQGGWRDVGINLGLGYSVTDTWTIETQAGVTRAIGDSADRERQREDEEMTDFFGGVFLNYKF
jgi:hypothetical protein